MLLALVVFFLVALEHILVSRTRLLRNHKRRNKLRLRLRNSLACETTYILHAHIATRTVVVMVVAVLYIINNLRPCSLHVASAAGSHRPAIAIWPVPVWQHWLRGQCQYIQKENMNITT